MEVTLAPLPAHQIFNITHSTDIAMARRSGQHLAATLGFDETTAGRLAIVLTEAATNILKHAGEGDVLLLPVQMGQGLGIDILAMDRGPGIGDLPQSLKDGYSSAGTTGTGLGAMRRLAADFDVYSRPGQGTVVYARVVTEVSATVAEMSEQCLDVGAVCLPKPGEEECGDTWSVRASGDGVAVMVSDGLGHGIEAAQASRAASAVFQRRGELTPTELLRALHDGMRATRGAAVGIVDVPCHGDRVEFAGVGNISASVHTGERRHHLLSQNGIVGYNMHRVQGYQASWPDDAICILHSDGLTSHWDLADYPGLYRRRPALIAGVLFRDACRNRDDATIVVVGRGA